MTWFAPRVLFKRPGSDPRAQTEVPLPMPAAMVTQYSTRHPRAALVTAEVLISSPLAQVVVVQARVAHHEDTAPIL